MFKLNIVKEIAVILIIFNIIGCATHSVWEKRAHNQATVIDETNATANGFFSKCEDIGSFKDGIIIPFTSNQIADEFPPIEKGYMVVYYDQKAENIIDKINDVQETHNGKLALSFLKAHFWESIDPDKKKKFWVGYNYGFKNKYGATTQYSTGGPNPGFIRSKEIKINFVQKPDNNGLGSNCESLTEIPINFDITFSQGYLKYSEYKNNRAFRIAATPFAVIVDVITSPFQFIAILITPLWAPR